MTDTKRKVWLITGASRGMGVEFVKTALKAGDKVVATARDVDSLKEKFNSNTNLLFTKLDVTKPEDAENSIKKSYNYVWWYRYPD